MKNYSVAPNQDASRWIVKLEDVAPTDSFPTKADAIDAAEELAKANRPSKVQILDDQHNLVEENEY